MDPRSTDQPPTEPNDEPIEKPPFSDDQKDDATDMSARSMSSDLDDALMQELSSNKAGDGAPMTSTPLVPPDVINPAVAPTVDKKVSHKPLIITIIVIAALATIVGLTLYVFASPRTSTDTTDTTQTEDKTITPATSETSSTTLDEAVEALTTGSSDEATISETDDSSSATDAATETGNVGGSIDENNF